MTAKSDGGAGMKFTETQRKLHQLLNEYEAAVIAENRGRNRSCYNEIENKYYQKRMELKEFVAELEGKIDQLTANHREIS